jgi:hypothetical protein
MTKTYNVVMSFSYGWWVLPKVMDRMVFPSNVGAERHLFIIN